jgi:membrane protein YdbS with pleckstrin-like domain
MLCPKCQVENESETVYCHACGARLNDEFASDRFTAEGSGPESDRLTGTVGTSEDPTIKAPPKEPTASAHGGPPPGSAAEVLASRRGVDDDPEEELWEGGYSPKALYGLWFLTAVLSIVVIVVAVFTVTSGTVWGIILGIIAITWLCEFALLAYRRMSVHYRLTTQRLFHEKGILSRNTDRIEVIDMDDITARQGVIERMFGIGSICVISSDRSHPEFHIVGIDNVHVVYDKLDKARRRERVRRGIHIESV